MISKHIEGRNGVGRKTGSYKFEKRRKELEKKKKKEAKRARKFNKDGVGDELENREPPMPDGLFTAASADATEDR